MNICMDFDDFSPLNHRFDLLERLRDRYPNIKITMFTVPWEIRLKPDGKGTPITQKEYEGFCDATRSWVESGNMEVALHGLTHAPQEFGDISYQEARNRIIVGLKMFENVGIKTVPLFKAPQWLISEQGKRAVSDCQLKLVEDGYYNWNLKDEMPKGKKKLSAHGHVQNESSTMNGIEQSFTRIMDIPSNANWEFLSERMK